MDIDPVVRHDVADGFDFGPVDVYKRQVFSEAGAFPEGIITVANIRKGTGNIAGVTIPTYEGADFSRGDYDLYELSLIHI